MMKWSKLGFTLLPVFTVLLGCSAVSSTTLTYPTILVLGTSQDAGTPQAGSHDHPGWTDPTKRRLASSIALLDPDTNQQWIFDITPDFPEQQYLLHKTIGLGKPLHLAGIFLTHAHIGHYTGLMHLGHEAMGAQGVPVFAMPRMHEFLSTNGPWDQLVDFNNIALHKIEADIPVALTDSIWVTALRVPHREEYSEVVGFRIEAAGTSALFIPDIDSWEQWDEQGTRIEDVLATVDIAFLDGSFYANGEIPGRDMTAFPHPRITHTLQRLSYLPASERAKVHFIHLNHTNPAHDEHSIEAQNVRAAGFSLAKSGMLYPLNHN